MDNGINLLGLVVIGKAGRDSDKYFVIVDIIDNNYVLIANGDSRKFENAKKKKLKHLKFTDIQFVDEINNIKNKTITNPKLRKLIKSLEIDKEV